MATEEIIVAQLTPNSDKQSRRRTSFVWDYFTIAPHDIRKAVCNNCGSEIVRGKDPRSFGTTSLASHIKYCYRSALDGDYVRRMKRKRPSTPFKSPHDEETGSAFSLSSSEIASYVYPNDDTEVDDDVICSRRMDLIHSGHLMNILYEQHKSGKFCDLTLISAPIIDVTPSVPQTSDTTLLTTGRKGNKKEFRAHSSILAAVSAKIKTPIEMGSRTIELKDVSAFGLKSLLEVIYTGKLKRKKPLRFIEAHQIWKAASDLGVKYVHDYLVNEHPQVAKWISDEEKKPNTRPTESFVYEITEDNESDLVDLCAHTPELPVGVEEHSQDSPQSKEKIAGEEVDVNAEPDTFPGYENQEPSQQSNGDHENESKPDDNSMVEITFDKT